jgi:hypothetical protein
MNNSKLKQAVYTNPAGDFKTERYVVETQEDLNAFLKAFPENKIMLKKPLTEDLERGKIIILTDPTRSGFSSYCYEDIVGDRDVLTLHPTSFIRVTLEDLKQDLINQVIDHIKIDIYEGDTTVLEELFKALPTSVLLHSLPEEQWDGFKLLAK